MRPLPRASTALASAAAGRRAVTAASALVASAIVAARRAVVVAARSSSPSPSSSSLPPPPPSEALSGTWNLFEKDEGVDHVMRVWGLPSVARHTAKQIKGFEMKIQRSGGGNDDKNDDGASSSSRQQEQQQHHLSVRYLCPVPQFSVREVVPVGSETRLRRRDLMPGGASASAAVLPGGGAVRVTTSWEGCEMEETYEACGDDTLTLHTTLRCRRRGAEETARAVQVYKRRIRDERAFLHLLGLSAKAAGTDGAARDPLARALSAGGRRAIGEYWETHCAPMPAGAPLGPAAAIAHARALAAAAGTAATSAAARRPTARDNNDHTNNSNTKGMAPPLFERLFLRLFDWPAWQARGLRDALDPGGRGLLSAEALTLAVALLAAGAGAGSGPGAGAGGPSSASAAGPAGGGKGDKQRVPDQEKEGPEEARRARAYEQLQGRLWPALALALPSLSLSPPGAGGDDGRRRRRDEAGEDEQQDVATTIPLDSVWTCARLLGAEERHLAGAWGALLDRRRDEDEERQDATAAAAVAVAVSPAEADALVRGALRSQASDPAYLALRAPCSGFEWPLPDNKRGRQRVAIAARGGAGRTERAAPCRSPVADADADDGASIRAYGGCCCAIS